MDTNKTLTRDGKPLETRSAQFRAQTFNPETRAITISLGTGAPVLRYDWNTGKTYTEVLSMDPAHVRLDRMNAGAPLLEDHAQWDSKSVVGRFIKGSVRVMAGELVGDARLSKAARHADTTGDIVDGILADTSVGYHVHKWEVSRDANGGEVRTAVDWEPIEGSIVPVPADPTGGVRAADDTVPTPDAPAPAAVADTSADGDAPNANASEERKMDEQKINEAREEGRRAEAARQNAIRALAAKHPAVKAEDVQPMLDDATVTPADAGLRLLDIVAKAAAANTVRSEVTVDEADKRERGIMGALLHRAGVVKELPAEARDYRGERWSDLARLCVENAGQSTRGMTRSQIVQAALHQKRAAHVTADFPNLTANLMGKVLEAERSLSGDYRWFERIATRVDLPDYKDRTVVGLGGISSLPAVLEGADYTRATFGDEKVAWHLSKRGIEVALTEELLINDDLNGFLRLVRQFARAATVTESAIAALGITSNPLMGDGVALFAAGHNNVQSGGGAAPGIATLAEGDNALRNQTDRDGARVGRPAMLIISPTTHRTVLEQIYSPQYSPTASTNAVTVPIAAGDRIYPAAFSGNPWYMHTGDTMSAEFGYLQGEGGPVVLDYAEERSDSRVYHCRDVFGFRVIDFRAWFNNAGA